MDGAFISKVAQDINNRLARLESDRNSAWDDFWDDGLPFFKAEDSSNVRSEDAEQAVVRDILEELIYVTFDLADEEWLADRPGSLAYVYRPAFSSRLPNPAEPRHD